MRQENLKNNRDILLETRNLSVEFPMKKKSFFEKQKMLSAVSDVSIQIRKGETFGLVGESGCGKSTFANATLGFVKPRSGEIYFNGQPLMPKKRRCRKQDFTCRRFSGPGIVFKSPLYGAESSVRTYADTRRI